MDEVNVLLGSTDLGLHIDKGYVRLEQPGD